MLRVCGLSLRYPNGKLALTDFSLTVEAGELVTILGGNGSGKTTLLRCITRTVKPKAGETNDANDGGQGVDHQGGGVSVPRSLGAQ